MVLKVEKISTKSQDFKQIKRVYEEVFPKVERIPLWLLKMRANEGKAEFCSLYDENEWVGFFYTILTKKLAYIFFLAVDPDRQGDGYGSQALEVIKERYQDYTMGLSSERPSPEAPNNAQRIRRQSFYERNGFTKAGFYSVEKGGVRYDFLSPQGKVKPNLYIDLMAEFFKQRQAYYLPLRVEKDDE